MDKEFLIRMVWKNGTVITLFCDQGALSELAANPKFIRFNDESNHIYVSSDDIAAFEVMNDRVEKPTDPEANGEPVNEACTAA